MWKKGDGTLSFAGSFCRAAGISVVSSGSGLTLILLSRFVSAGMDVDDGPAAVGFEPLEPLGIA